MTARWLTAAVCALILSLSSTRAEPTQTSGEGLRAVNGTELFVKRIGSGEPIVVIHGGPVLEHGYLLPHLEPLAETHELIFYDQRLSGRSAPTVPSESVRLATFVEDIEALRTALELGRIHVIGHSWGGLLAMRYAIEHPEHLRSLILLDSMSASSERWKEEEAAVAERITDEDREAQQGIRDSDDFKKRRPDAIRKLLLASFALQFHDRSALSKLDLYVPEDYSARSQQFGAMMVDLESFDFHDDVAGIAAPVLILYGDAEPGRSIGGTALAEALPNASVATIEDAGHFPFVEQPDAFLGAVRGFLKSASTTP